MWVGLRPCQSFDRSNRSKSSQQAARCSAKLAVSCQAATAERRPEMNPDELVWGWTKYGRLGNLAAANSGWLRDYLINEFTYVRERPELLVSFTEGSGLPLIL